MNFVALSIKRANQWPDSICGIELVKVQENSIVDSISTYINTSQEFDPFYTSQHGIEQTDVLNSPSFNEFTPILDHWLSNENVISFYKEFESSSLQEAYTVNNKIPPIFTHFSLLPYIKSEYSQWPLFTIPHIAANLDLTKLYNDAENIAAIAITTLKNRNSWTDAIKKISKTTSVSIESLALKTIIFTGGLAGMTRNSAAKLAMRTGAYFTNTMSKKVDILVVSHSSRLKYEDTNHRSSKWQKAIQLQQNGHPITILFEEDFMNLVR